MSKKRIFALVVYSPIIAAGLISLAFMDGLGYAITGKKPFMVKTVIRCLKGGKP